MSPPRWLIAIGLIPGFASAAPDPSPVAPLPKIEVGKQVEKQELQPGDLVFYNTLKRGFSHVGIYLGDNKFIHSPSAGGQVRIESMDLGYWKSRFNGARRIEQPEQH